MFVCRSGVTSIANRYIEGQGMGRGRQLTQPSWASDPALASSVAAARSSAAVLGHVTVTVCIPMTVSNTFLQ